MMDSGFSERFAGGSPAAGYFSCSAKKSNQKKAAPARGPSGYPALLAKPGGSATRPRKRGLRQCSPTAPGFAVLLGGSQGGDLTGVGMSQRSVFAPPDFANHRGIVKFRFTRTHAPFNDVGVGSSQRQLLLQALREFEHQ